MPSITLPVISRNAERFVKVIRATFFCFGLLVIAGVLPVQSLAEVTRVGVVIPLSGVAALSGVTIRNSISLASRKFDPEGKVRFLFEDDALTPSKTVTAVNKLILEDKVSALIVFGTPTSLAVAEIAEERRIPMVALSILNRVVTGKSYVVKHWVSAREENREVLNEIRRRKYKSVAVVATLNDAMLDLRDQFIESGEIKPAVSAEFAKDDMDFRTVIAKIVQAKPAAVYNLLWSPQTAAFSKQLRAARFAGDIFGVHNLDNQAEIEASEDTLRGAWFVTGDDSGAEEYYSQYLAQFGVNPVAGGTNAFDVATMILKGLGGSDLNNYLHTVKDFHGACGDYSATGFNDFSIRPKVKEVR